MNFKQLFSIPNLLCYFRIRMIPSSPHLQAETSADYLFSALILGIMEFTDFLDGFIARKYHMVTEAGKIIDPIADKLLQLHPALLSSSAIRSHDVLLILFLIKEASMAVCGLVSIKRKCRLDGALWCGKVSRPCFISAWSCSSSSQGSITPWQTSCCASPPRSCYIPSSSIMKTYYHMLKKKTAFQIEMVPLSRTKI